MSRFLDARDTRTRSLLLDLSGLGYLLVVGQTGRPPTPPQWALAALAFASALLLHRRQPINLLVQTTLFAVATVRLDDATINQVGTAWAIGELALWAPRTRHLVAGTAAVAAVHLICDPPTSPGRITPSLIGLAVNLGLPVLLGLVVRTTREVSVQAERRALEEQRRRESEHRAARADERGAIARELHDVVAHHVASMVLRVGVARHVLPDLDPRAAEVFDDVHRTGTAALADLRRLVAVLRDPDAVRGDAALTAIDPSALPAALDGAVETARTAGVIVEAEIDPAVARLDAVRGLALLRLTQEALTNVAKHAGPDARAQLRVAMSGTELHWSVTDDGGRGGGVPDAAPPPSASRTGAAGSGPSPSVPGDGRSGPSPSVPGDGRSGPSPSAPRDGRSGPSVSPAGDGGAGSVPGGGHGLTGMRERVAVLGGSLVAGPSGRGWRVATVLPGEHPAAESPAATFTDPPAPGHPGAPEPASPAPAIPVPSVPAAPVSPVPAAPVSPVPAAPVSPVPTAPVSPVPAAPAAPGTAGAPAERRIPEEDE
ncbi:sensor histidine kinase [Actinoplanes teichomyceticus]|uniref:histidine kinase n=1 Tax=Actinoplanes teichomyceticus TaxID=1867 RepID=A0A561VSI1_ACTTI|nr:histidine kinase [Actinoplanes teichomyceticus]TWG14566.1 signal transduction histidine kinase [Actinoplanes teichomyceticus]GIF09970.1 hypothetical protein Ate01nite_00020 [Actinoplanes teichomyceticus]